MGRDVLGRILDAGLELARLEADGVQLDPDELAALDCCDEIAGVRDTVAGENGSPAPRDPDAPADPHDPLYDF